MKTTTLLLGALTAFAGTAFGFEDTKVLPQGVRNIDVRSVTTDFDEQTNDYGAREPLAQPLEANLTFDQIAKGESTLKGNELRAFLQSNNISDNQSVGQFSADLKGHMQIVAPIMAYGITDRLTAALAIPFYQASTSVAVGFQPNANASNFLSLLSNPKNNQTASAREAASDFNNAVQQLNQKLFNDHYSELQDWQGSGVGDTTLAAKYQAVNYEHFVLAMTPGLIVPTGATANPDNLTSVPFGNGVWAPYLQMTMDELTPGAFRITQYVKYTNQLPNTENVRAVTPDDQIVPDYTRTQYKLGDMLDAGADLLWEPHFGLVAGGGYIFHHQYGSVYRGDIDPQTRTVLEMNSEQKSDSAEFQLGYSTVQLYQTHQVAVPMDMELTYTKQLKSWNMPVTNLTQLDLNLYF